MDSRQFKLWDNDDRGSHVLSICCLKRPARGFRRIMISHGPAEGGGGISVWQMRRQARRSGHSLFRVTRLADSTLSLDPDVSRPKACAPFTGNGALSRLLFACWEGRVLCPRGWGDSPQPCPEGVRGSASTCRRYLARKRERRPSDRSARRLEAGGVQARGAFQIPADALSVALGTASPRRPQSAAVSTAASDTSPVAQTSLKGG